MSNWTKDLTIGKPDTIGTMIYGPHSASVAWCGCGSAYDSGGSYSIRPAEAHANAKLYAAAPELADALKTFFDAISKCEEPEITAFLGSERAALMRQARGDAWAVLKKLGEI